MCQTCGHSGLTLDSIINIAGLLTLSLSVESHLMWFKAFQPAWGKWTRGGVCLDGLDDCAWCGAFSTPALPSVPLHSLWPRRFLAHNKCRTGASMNTPHSRPFEGTGKASVAYFKNKTKKAKIMSRNSLMLYENMQRLDENWLTVATEPDNLTVNSSAWKTTTFFNWYLKRSQCKHPKMPHLHLSVCYKPENTSDAPLHIKRREVQ